MTTYSRVADLRKRAGDAQRTQAQQEELNKKAAEQAALEKAMEKTRKAANTAQQVIAIADLRFEKAADTGFFSARIYDIPSDEIVVRNGVHHVSYDLSGAAQLIMDHFKKEGFTVIVDSQTGYAPDYGNNDGGPTITYFIKVGW